jgi:hypothetical protein
MPIEHALVLPPCGFYHNGQEFLPDTLKVVPRSGTWGDEELKYTYALIDAYGNGTI